LKGKIIRDPLQTSHNYNCCLFTDGGAKKRVRGKVGEQSHESQGGIKEEKGMTEDEMVGWHHQLNGYEFE